MYKIKALLSFFMFGSLLNNCGYTPRYSSNEKVNFSIQINNVSGDREFNNLIKSELSRHNKNTEKTFVVDYDSKYEKNERKRKKNEKKKEKKKREVKMNVKRKGKEKDKIKKGNREMRKGKKKKKWKMEKKGAWKRKKMIKEI